MKILILVLLTLTYFSGIAQEKNFKDSVLQLGKNKTSGRVKLMVKPSKKIKIRTLDGERFFFRHYSLVGDSAIASLTDTVALKDIKYIKASVKGNVLRKVSGAILSGVGWFYTSGGIAVGLILAMSGGGQPYFLLSLPAIGVTYIGLILVGPRRFDTSEKWTLNITTKPE